MLTIFAMFYLQCYILHHNMHHVVPSFHSLYQSVNYVWYPAFMGHLWFIIQIVCTHSPLKDCWHFTMQYLQDLLVLEMFKHPDMGEFMIYRVIYIFLYESHWMFIPRRLYLAHIEDCSALWIGNLTLIDVDVHLQPLCNTFCLQECIYSYFSGHLLWFLLIMNKCMLFHPPDDCMGMDTALMGLVQPTVKSNEFCLYVLQLLALGIPSIQEINSVPFLQ